MRKSGQWQELPLTGHATAAACDSQELELAEMFGKGATSQTADSEPTSPSSAAPGSQTKSKGSKGTGTTGSEEQSSPAEAKAVMSCLFLCFFVCMYVYFFLAFFLLPPLSPLFLVAGSALFLIMSFG